MDARAVWDVGAILSGTSLSAVATWLVSAYKFGKREGKRDAALAELQRERQEEKRHLAKERAMQSRQNMRIFAAIEQLRRLHKTGNGGVVWEKLDSGGE